MINLTSRLVLTLLVLAPLCEIATFALVAQSAGFWTALAGVILISLVGMAVLRRQGASFLAGMPAGAISGGSVGERLLAGLAGVLLALPGYLSGVAGLFLLVGPVRRQLVKLAGRRFGSGDAPGGMAKTDGSGTIDLGADEFRHR